MQYTHLDDAVGDEASRRAIGEGGDEDASLGKGAVDVDTLE